MTTISLENDVDAIANYLKQLKKTKAQNLVKSHYLVSGQVKADFITKCKTAGVSQNAAIEKLMISFGTEPAAKQLTINEQLNALTDADYLDLYKSLVPKARIIAEAKRAEEQEEKPFSLNLD